MRTPSSSVTHGKPALLHAEIGFTPERVAARVAKRLGVAELGSATAAR